MNEESHELLKEEWLKCRDTLSTANEYYRRHSIYLSRPLCEQLNTFFSDSLVQLNDVVSSNAMEKVIDTNRLLETIQDEFRSLIGNTEPPGL
jgi:hypothetical protein